MSSQSAITTKIRRRSSVEGKNVVLTGGSTGIGRTIAETFVADGANVTICSRNREEIKETATTINENDYPGQAHGVAADVTEPTDLKHLHKAANDRFGQVDTLINNVGGAGGPAQLDEMKSDLWEYIIKLNLFSTFYVTQEFASDIKNSGGVVVNISSFVSQFGVSGMGAYAPAKSGVNGLTRVLAKEWESSGVRVNAVSPGYIATEGLKQHLGLDRTPSREEVDRTLGTPPEVADLVRFLASPAASLVTGQIVTAMATSPTVELPSEQSD